jgi:hypothetical protein
MTTMLAHNYTFSATITPAITITVSVAPHTGGETDHFAAGLSCRRSDRSIKPFGGQ